MKNFKINYEKLSGLEGWGKLSIENLKKAIDKGKTISLDRFIYSIGIRHIGQENAKILAGFFISVEKFSSLFIQNKRKKILDSLIDLDGIGLTQIESIEIFFSDQKNIEVVNKYPKAIGG